MRNLLFGVTLLLFALVYSTPVEHVTQFPTDTDDDVLKEVLDDGYLLDEFTPRILTTRSPRIHTTVQASQQPTSDSKNIEIEGSVDVNAEPSTTPTVQDRDTSVTNATESESSTAAEEIGEPSLVSTTTESSGLSSSVPPKASPTASTVSTTTESSGLSSSVTPEASSTPSSVSTTTESSGLPSSVPPEASPTPVFTTTTNDIEDSNGDVMGKGGYGSGSGSGSGSGDMPNFVTIAKEMTSLGTSRSTSSSTSSSSSSFPLGENSESGAESITESVKESNTESESDKASGKDSDEASDKESGKPGPRSGSKKSRMFDTLLNEVATQQHGHDKVILNDQKPSPESHYRTPGWIIILAFVVGLAGLVMLCVAIATRDKWNGPHKSTESKKSSSSDQQREQEMTTFVHKESPRENGKAGEYTVIPLDELPESYSSH